MTAISIPTDTGVSEYERDLPDRRAPLMKDGECWGVFVNPELRAGTQRAVEQAHVSDLARVERQVPRCLRPHVRTGGGA
jgi:hypothetical protein